MLGFNYQILYVCAHACESQVIKSLPVGEQIFCPTTHNLISLQMQTWIASVIATTNTSKTQGKVSHIVLLNKFLLRRE